jgi:hypothetical protein
LPEVLGEDLCSVVKLVVFMLITSFLTLTLAATIGNITSVRRPSTGAVFATSPAAPRQRTLRVPVSASGRSTRARSASATWRW